MQIQRAYNKVQSTGNIQEQESKIRLGQKTSKSLPCSGIRFFGLMKPRLANLYQTDGKRKVWRRRGTTHDPKPTPHLVSNKVVVVLWHGHVWLFIDGVTADRSIAKLILSSLRLYTLCSHSAKCYKTDRTQLHSADG